MVTTLALRRRTFTERTVLGLLRGDAEAVGRQAVGARCFAALRRIAAARGFAVLAPAAPYMGLDELALLSRIAAEQRIVADPDGTDDDPVLATAVARCAGILDAMGLRLSPLTLYGARLRERPRRSEGDRI